MGANDCLLDTLMPQKNISCQIIHISYLEKESKLMLIGNKRVLLTMKDIIYCFFEKQRSLLKLQRETKELERESRIKKEEEAKSEKWTFKVHPLLSGYLRGARGSNIEKVRERNPNILSIKPQNGSCYISAKDKMSLNEAIDALQIVCKKVIIPKDEMGQIIGSRGTQIQDIKSKSKVIKIISWVKWADEFRTLKEIQTSVRQRYRGYNYQNMKKEEVNEDDFVPDEIKNATVDNIFEDDANDALVIIGRKSRVELCVFMIEMTLNHFRNITRTRNNVRKLRRKINEIKGNQGPPYGGYGRGRGRRGRGRGRGGGQRGRGRG